MRNICREERLKHKMTQEQFAKLLQKTRQTIHRWEKNPEEMPLRAIVKIITLNTVGDV